MPEAEPLQDRPRRHRQLIQIGILAVAYFVTGRLGLELAHLQDNATLFWPPTGLSLAALLLFGLGLWPGVAIGAAAVNLAIGTPPGPSLAIAVGNTLEAVVGAWAVLRLAGFGSSLERVRDVAALMLIGVLGCTVISAVIGVGALLAAGLVAGDEVARVGLIWWMGDAGAVILITPLLLVWRNGSPPWSVLLRRLESWVVVSLLVVVGVVGFGTSLGGPTALLLAFVAFAIVAWAGGRLGPRGAVTASAIISTIAVVGTSRGLGPLAGQDVHAMLMSTWAYAACMGATGLLLAAAIAERERAEVEQRREQDERRRLELKMLDTQRLESLGVLAGGVAHDFNNILVAIRCNAELLRDQVGSSDARHLVEDIETASSRAGDLCRRLLQSAGRGPTSKTDVSIEEVLEDLDAIVRPSFPDNVSLKRSVPAGLPTVRADATALRQVITNLVLNAAEAMHARGGAIWLRLFETNLYRETLSSMPRGGQVAPGRFVCIEVEDSGEGIGPEDVHRVFDPFFSTKFAGRGLGLAAVWGIVREHDGAVDIRSTRGEGTRVRVYLPPGGPPAARPASSAPVEDEASIGTVLVVDDEPLVRRVVGRILERAGFSVVSAEDGERALERHAALGSRIDAVLLDVKMPKMGGMSTLAELRRRDPLLPVALMSGYVEGPAEDAQAADDFIHKPAEAQRIVECAQSLVSQRRTARAHARGA